MKKYENIDMFSNVVYDKYFIMEDEFYGSDIMDIRITLCNGDKFTVNLDDLVDFHWDDMEFNWYELVSYYINYIRDTIWVDVTDATMDSISNNKNLNIDTLTLKTYEGKETLINVKLAKQIPILELIGDIYYTLRVKKEKHFTL